MRLAIATVLAALAFPASANALTPTTSPVVHRIAAYAITYWGERGIVVPCGAFAIQMGTMADLSAHAGLSTDTAAGIAMPNCTFAVRIRDVRDVERLMSRPRQWDWARVRFAFLCTVELHEVGHEAGLEHSANGVMTPEVGAPPPECNTLARKMIPRPLSRHRNAA